MKKGNAFTRGVPTAPRLSLMFAGSGIKWIFGGGIAIASASFGIVACSSSPAITDNTVVPGPDSSVKTDSGNNNPDTSVDPDAGNPNPDGSSGCLNPPKLFPPSMKGLYCPFSASGDAGSSYCKVGTEKCCVSPSADAGPSVCTASNTACPGKDAVWACAAPEECGGQNPVCCLTAGPTEPDPNCAGYTKTKGFNNTRCTTAQACSGMIDAGKYIDNQYVVCTKQADCAMGTCTAIKTSGTSIGICM
jgi:hypothetical protein